MASLHDRLEKRPVPGGGGWRSIWPGDVERDARIVDDLLDVRNEGLGVRIRQKTTVEAHLGLLGNNVDLVATAEHREADGVVEEWPGGAELGHLAAGGLATNAADP